MAHFPSFAFLSVVLIAGAYLLGSLSGARVLRSLTARSGSVAATSIEPGIEGRRFIAARTAFDLIKAILAVWLALRFAPVGEALSVTAHGYLAAFAVLGGHVWPVWHRFRGGGGTVALTGALLVLWPVGAVTWLIASLLVWLRSAHAGLSAVLGAVCLPLLVWWVGGESPRLWFAVAAPLLLALGHRHSLSRMWSGTEPRFARARRLYRWRRK
ncbi:MAG: glycerol-3-phosphate acyltransferase [Lysobacter sp.]|nr:glycerol-3-phosphate acyltransferase [Lysobacter sp.]